MVQLYRELPRLLKIGMKYPPFIRKMLKHSEIEKDKEGWVDASKFVPEDYELVSVILDGVAKKRAGWVCGFVWDGLHIDRTKKVLFWRKDIKETHEHTRI